jgi:hypothetical protein
MPQSWGTRFNELKFFSEEKELRNWSLCSFLRRPVTSPFYVKIPFEHPVLTHLQSCFPPLNVRSQFHVYKQHNIKLYFSLYVIILTCDTVEGWRVVSVDTPAFPE